MAATAQEHNSCAVVVSSLEFQPVNFQPLSHLAFHCHWLIVTTAREQLILMLLLYPLDLIGTIGVLEILGVADVKNAEGSLFELSLEYGVVSKFVDILVILFALGDGSVLDCVA